MNIWKLSQHNLKDVESKISETQFHRENICTPLHSGLLIFFIDLDFSLLDFALKVAAVTLIRISERRIFPNFYRAVQSKHHLLILYQIKCFFFQSKQKANYWKTKGKVCFKEHSQLNNGWHVTLKNPLHKPMVLRIHHFLPVASLCQHHMHKVAYIQDHRDRYKLIV